MKKIISYLGIYIVLHSMYLIQGCCGRRTCQSVSTIEAFYQKNIGDTIVAGDTVAYDSVEIVVTPTTYNAQCYNINPWLSSAYALSCNDEIYAMTKLQKMVITATQDYTTAYPSGTSLTELFVITQTYYDNYYNYGEGLASSYSLRFKTPPDNDMPLHLTVQFFYEHFEQPFEGTLPVIFIKK